MVADLLTRVHKRFSPASALRAITTGPEDPGVLGSSREAAGAEEHSSARAASPPPVTVKDKVGRVRYVALRVEPACSRGALTATLPAFAKLTRFDGEWGIVRVGHRDRDALLAALADVRALGGKDARVQSVATSGTLRGAARALPPTSEASVRSRRADAGR